MILIFRPSSAIGIGVGKPGAYWMKPRRWYSSPELKPSCNVQLVQPFPTSIYWAFATLTRREQGAIIKSRSPQQSEPALQRGKMVRKRVAGLRRIDAA